MSKCIFCDINARTASAEILWSSGGKHPVLAIKDANPVAATHVLLLAPSHLPTNMTAAASKGMAKLARLAPIVAAHLGLKDYRIVINNGTGAGQQINHMHLHLLAPTPGRVLSKLG